jgi:hypothetical protein
LAEELKDIVSKRISRVRDSIVEVEEKTLEKLIRLLSKVDYEKELAGKVKISSIIKIVITALSLFQRKLYHHYPIVLFVDALLNLIYVIVVGIITAKKFGFNPDKKEDVEFLIQTTKKILRKHAKSIFTQKILSRKKGKFFFLNNINQNLKLLNLIEEEFSEEYAQRSSNSKNQKQKRETKK